MFNQKFSFQNSDILESETYQPSEKFDGKILNTEF